MPHKKQTGQRGEQLICERLAAEGFEVLDRNVREKFAEIDIVAKQDSCLCFIEVRTREDTRLGHPLETITERKKSLIRRAAEAYLTRHKIRDTEVRFDVATVVWSTMEMDYIKDAF
jgi:putative endonuclease